MEIPAKKNRQDKKEEEEEEEEESDKENTLALDTERGAEVGVLAHSVILWEFYWLELAAVREIAGHCSAWRQASPLEESSQCHFDLSSQAASYLASAAAPVVPAHNVFVVLVLLGQVVEEHALGHRLKQGKTALDGCLTPGSSETERGERTFLSRKDAIRLKFLGCWMNLRADQR